MLKPFKKLDFAHQLVDFSTVSPRFGGLAKGKT
jgi:hypothetical protein